jgi:hypothetical protein
MKFSSFTPLQYLKIDVASSFGLDRSDWSERLNWFDSNQHQLKSLVIKAKEPALFFAAVEAFEKASQGHPTGHLISLDATASGIQILSLMSGDHSAARHCNILNTGHRQDAYTNIDTLMRDMMDFAHVDRKQSKYALMTTLFGSDAVPKAVFGEGALLDLFETVSEREMPAVWALNKALLRCWNPTALKYEWKLPDNFHVVIKVMGSNYQTVNFMGQAVDIHTKVNIAQEQGRSIGANITHSVDGMVVREMTRRCNYDPAVIADTKAALYAGRGKGTNRPKDKMLAALWSNYRLSGWLTARIFDYIDMHNVDLIDRTLVLDLIATLPKKPFPVISNHDCFRVHPNNAEAMRLQYNRQMAELGASNMLNFICTQILGVPVNTQKMQEFDFEEILSADYALS